MIDAAQTVLLFVIVVLSVLLVVLGIQVFFILRGLRDTVSKANRVLDDTASITESVSAPLASLSSLASNEKIGSIIAIAKVVKGIFGKEKSSSEKKQKKE